MSEGNLPHTDRERERESEGERERERQRKQKIKKKIKRASERASWMPNNLVTAGNRAPQVEFPSSALPVV